METKARQIQGSEDGREGTGCLEEGVAQGTGVFLRVGRLCGLLPIGRFSQAAARWWCCSGSIPGGPEAGLDNAWHSLLSLHSPKNLRLDQRQSKIFYLLYIHEIKV